MTSNLPGAPHAGFGTIARSPATRHRPQRPSARRPGISMECGPHRVRRRNPGQRGLLRWPSDPTMTACRASSDGDPIGPAGGRALEALAHAWPPGGIGVLGHGWPPDAVRCRRAWTRGAPVGVRQQPDAGKRIRLEHRVPDARRRLRVRRPDGLKKGREGRGSGRRSHRRRRRAMYPASDAPMARAPATTLGNTGIAVTSTMAQSSASTPSSTDRTS